MAKVLRSRAFDAFLPDAEPGEELPNARQLPLACIVPNPHQARQAFAPEKLEELAVSIREHGVLEPILVQALGDDRYRILAGERRYRAATAVGLTHIPALIREDLTEEAAAFITATENLQRADLDIEDEARQFAYLLQLTGLSQRALADKLGVSKDYLHRRVLLLQHPELLAALRAGTLTQRDALQQAIHGLPIPPAPALVERDVLDTASQAVSHGATAAPSNAEVARAAPSMSHGATGAYPTIGPAALVDATRENVSHGATVSPAGSVSCDDLDDPAPDNSPAIPPLPIGPRWRYVEEAARALRRIDPTAIPPGERPAWVREVTALETLLADLKGRLVALVPERDAPAGLALAHPKENP